MIDRVKDHLADYLEEHPRIFLSGVLLLLATFCGGSFVFGQGPVQAIERLFFPATFVYSSTGGPGDWYEAYFIEPPQSYDSDLFDGAVPERLIQLIEGADQSIDIAGFEFDLTPVAEALIAAHDRGVAVRWYTDDEHGLGADVEDGHGQFKMLADAGIPIRSDDRQSLMHNKFILFDEEIVWTGSTNLTRNGMFKNDNNVLIVHEPQLAREFSRQFRELWQGKSSSERKAAVRRQTIMIEDTPVLTLFSPEDNPMDSVLPMIRKAKKSVYFMTFAFTHDELGMELQQKARRGIDVRGVFESRNASSEHSEIHRLFCSGVAVREDGNPANMHHKIFIIDGQVVITGSYNFSNNSEGSNDENMVFLSNSDIASAYLKEFERVWAASWPPSPQEMDC